MRCERRALLSTVRWSQPPLATEHYLLVKWYPDGPADLTFQHSGGALKKAGQTIKRAQQLFMGPPVSSEILRRQSALSKITGRLSGEAGWRDLRKIERQAHELTRMSSGKRSQRLSRRCLNCQDDISTVQFSNQRAMESRRHCRFAQRCASAPDQREEAFKDSRL